MMAGARRFGLLYEAISRRPRKPPSGMSLLRQANVTAPEQQAEVRPDRRDIARFSSFRPPDDEKYRSPAPR